MSRPFVNWSIIQLETEFDRACFASDKSTLDLIVHELQFRETHRAHKLSERVARVIGDLRARNATAPARPKGHSHQPRSEVLSAGSHQADDDASEHPMRLADDLPPPREPRPETPRRAPFVRRPVPPVPQAKQLRRGEAADLLSAWIALEVLSPPQTYRKPQDLADGDLRRIANFDRFPDLPWQRGEKARPNTRLFYQIPIGAIGMEDATAKLLSVYSDEDIDRVRAGGSAPIAILTIDSKGIPVQPTALAISSFAWGLPYALRKELSALGNWPIVEPKLIEEADRLVRRTSEDEEILPLDRPTIDTLFSHLVSKLALPTDCITPPSFAVRVYHWWRADDPPDPPPMGSFFLGDLARARGLVESQSVPDLLERYLGLAAPPDLIDIRRDDIALAEAIAPSRFPTACWPSRGGHPLVVLQQAAVNLAVSGDTATKLLPVNGPPGTGKTTLLRDLAVALVVQRARILTTFANPEGAFAAAGQRFKSGNTFTQYYKIDSRLLGFEIVVASSNNKAVENVSTELPALKAIEDRYEELRYFKSVADNVARRLAHGPSVENEKNDKVDDSLEFTESWGLFAAVLGNAKNRYSFRQAAWSNPDTGLRSYLLEASGNPQTIEIKDKQTGRIIEKRKPRVVTVEKPPKTSDDALKGWNVARKAFLQAVRRVEERLSILEKGRLAVASGDLSLRRRHAGEALTQLEKRLEDLRQKNEALASAIDRMKVDLASAERSIAAHEEGKPGPFGRLFRSSSYAEWERQLADLLRARKQVATRLADAERTLATVVRAEEEVVRDLSAARRLAAAIVAAINEQSADIQRAAVISGSRFVDGAFLERGETDLHRDTPWLDSETTRLREEVFLAAMDLHGAFVDSNAKQIRNNLDILFRTFFGRSAWTDQIRPLMPTLWATFFCVVPIVSTTFASIERMLGYLPPEALGWLLIDEAGQAVPQAAVGALLRARHAIVVGDPIQLPPVTSLPTELADKIADQFRVDKERFIAPSASVQSLADTTSVYGTVISSDAENIRVGVPLVVHRRCADPMFSLSNKVAYGGMMVQGRGHKHSHIRDILGPSAWIDVKPDRCEDKWSIAEGRAVLHLFRRLDRAEVDEIDIYLISPFRIVAQKLRELLVAENALARWTTEPRIWVRERIGTVYTVQGREADTIIMVLGAAEPQRRGARNWAGQDVNQLNVAVTRAKENLYVIGNRFEWASAGKFEYLERVLPDGIP